jgi:hypothetical protein
LHNLFFYDIKIELSSTCAPVAQLDRALDFESIGRPFESGRAYHFKGFENFFPTLFPTPRVIPVNILCSVIFHDYFNLKGISSWPLTPETGVRFPVGSPS